MSYELKPLLAIEKELARPENDFENGGKGAIDIRDYYSYDLKRVTDFTPAQSWYIQKHLDFINSLYAKDQEVYDAVPLLSAGYKEDYPKVPKYSLDGKGGLTKFDWINGWSSYSSPYHHRYLTISHGFQFKAFVHTFKRHLYGYFSPQEKYRFHILSNNICEDFPLNKVGDLELIDLYHEVASGRQTRESLLESSSQDFAPNIHFLCDYFSKHQDEDLTVAERAFYHKDAPKHHFAQHPSAYTVKNYQRKISTGVSSFVTKPVANFSQGSRDYRGQDTIRPKFADDGTWEPPAKRAKFAPLASFQVPKKKFVDTLAYKRPRAHSL